MWAPPEGHRPHLHLELAENGVPTDPAAAYPGLELSVTGR